MNGEKGKKTVDRIFIFGGETPDAKWWFHTRAKFSCSVFNNRGLILTSNKPGKCIFISLSAHCLFSKCNFKGSLDKHCGPRRQPNCFLRNYSYLSLIVCIKKKSPKNIETYWLLVPCTRCDSFFPGANFKNTHPQVHPNRLHERRPMPWLVSHRLIYVNFSQSLTLSLCRTECVYRYIFSLLVPRK